MPLLALVFLLACLPTGSGTSRFVSKTFLVEALYPVGEGPEAAEKALLITNHPGELIWLTSCRVQLVGPEEQPEPMRLLGRLDVDWTRPGRHAHLMGYTAEGSARAFSLGEACPSLTFPTGFALPTKSNEPFSVTTQLKNDDPTTSTVVRSVVEFDFTRERGLAQPMVPLRAFSATGLVTLESGTVHYANESVDSRLGPGCASFPAANESSFKDPLGRSFASSWTLPPGEHTTHTLVTRMMNLPFDTTIHQATAQVYPHAVSLELRDLTDSSSVLTLRRKAAGAEFESYSSQEGLKVFKDHEYELVVTYLNPTRDPITAGAVLSLYVRDHQFTVEGLKH